MPGLQRCFSWELPLCLQTERLGRNGRVWQTAGLLGAWAHHTAQAHDGKHAFSGSTNAELSTEAVGEACSEAGDHDHDDQACYAYENLCSDQREHSSSACVDLFDNHADHLDVQLQNE